MRFQARSALPSSREYVATPPASSAKVAGPVVEDGGLLVVTEVAATDTIEPRCGGDEKCRRGALVGGFSAEPEGPFQEVLAGLGTLVTAET